ncbi:enoyl-CoA hydratase-related protein [Niallia sp. Krafla_26]|uniref:enoyl-CoA hydratase-related protein n=1 Tax=Niallia sp. Krafla_26 TaxID=3064703 RepID=UPI003D1859FC
MTVNFLKDALQVEVNGRVAKIELEKPHVLHRIQNDMIKELIQKLKEISLSDEIQIVILTGKEEAFFSEFRNSILNEIENENDFYYTMELINELMITIYSMPKITIAGISGRASGLGISLSLATDHILVDESCQFVMNTMEQGIIPVGGAHFFLERRLGEDRARHLIWESKTLSAQEAKALNLVNEIAKGDLNEAIDNKVKQWGRSPILAMIKTKKILGEKNRPYLLKMLELEKFALYRMMQTEDYQECCQAFKENRKPTYLGK